MHGERTTCACRACVDCCLRQPGPLAPGDLEAIAAHMGETVEEVKAYFVASKGAVVMDSQTGRQFRVGTITPRTVRGHCVFLDEQDRCRIHAVAPYGCAFFDTHMDRGVAIERGSWLVRQQATEEYQRLRATLPEATTYNPTRY